MQFLIPIKRLRRAKSRLGIALDDDTRLMLIEAMLNSVIDACREAAPDAPVAIVTSDETAAGWALARGCTLLPDEGEGCLNAALEKAARRLPLDEPLAVLPADIPGATGRAISVLLHVGEGTAFIVPDRAGTGTNGLVMPAGRRFAFRFGLDSAMIHAGVAADAGLQPRLLPLKALADDMDTPADLLRFCTNAPLPATFSPILAASCIRQVTRLSGLEAAC